MSSILRVVGPLDGKFDFSFSLDLKFKAILITKVRKSSSTQSELYANEKYLMHCRETAKICIFSKNFDTDFKVQGKWSLDNVILSWILW